MTRKPEPREGERKNYGHTPGSVKFGGEPAFKWSPPTFAHNDKVRVCDLHAKPYHVGVNKRNT